MILLYYTNKWELLDTKSEQYHAFDHLRELLNECRKKVTIWLYSSKKIERVLRKLLEIEPSLTIGKNNGKIYYVNTKKIRFVFFENIVLNSDKEFSDIWAFAHYVKEFYSTLRGYLTELHDVKTIEKLEEFTSLASLAFSAMTENNEYSKLCPPTTAQEFNFLSPAYRAGFLLAKSGVYHDAYSYDRRSAYPYQYSYMPLPIGRGTWCKSENELLKYDFYVIKIKATFVLNPNKFPIIQDDDVRGTSNYLEKGVDTVLTLAKPDYELFKKFYTSEYNYIEGIGYTTCRNFYIEYGEYFYNKKKSASGSPREICKGMLNTPYGKLGTRGEFEKHSYKNNNGKIERWIDVIKKRRYEYLPQAIAICAYQRYDEISTIDRIGYDNVVYADTDSVKTTKKVNFIDRGSMGDWKEESKGSLLIVNKKQYITFDEYSLDVKATVSGCSKKWLEENINNLFGEKSEGHAYLDFLWNKIQNGEKVFDFSRDAEDIFENTQS